MNKLNIDRMLNEKQIIKVGELSQEVIDKLNLQEKPRNIIPHFFVNSQILHKTELLIALNIITKKYVKPKEKPITLLLQVFGWAG